MTSKFNALLQNHTWELVATNSFQIVVGCKWVFRIKHNSNGSIEIYKACFVVKGFYQQLGLNYSETFSPIDEMVFFFTCWFMLMIYYTLGITVSCWLYLLTFFLLILLSRIQVTCPIFKVWRCYLFRQVCFSLKRIIFCIFFRENHYDCRQRAYHSHVVLNLFCSFDGASLSTATRVARSLQYMSLTPPIITFSINKLSQFMHQPIKVLWTVSNVFSPILKVLCILGYFLHAILLLFCMLFVMSIGMVIRMIVLESYSGNQESYS